MSKGMRLKSTLFVLVLVALSFFQAVARVSTDKIVVRGATEVNLTAFGQPVRWQKVFPTLQLASAGEPALLVPLNTSYEYEIFRGAQSIVTVSSGAKKVNVHFIRTRDLN